VIKADALPCAECGWENPNGSHFCNQCGIPLAVAAARAPEQERTVGAANGADRVEPGDLAERAERLQSRRSADEVEAAGSLAQRPARPRRIRLSWLQIQLTAFVAASASRMSASVDIVSSAASRVRSFSFDRLSLAGLIGTLGVLLMLVALGPVVWDSGLPAFRRLSREMPLQLAVVAAVALVATLAAGAASWGAPTESLSLVRRATRAVRAPIATRRSPGGLVLALALAVVAEGLLLTGSTLLGIVCYALAAVAAWRKARTTPTSHDSSFGALARRYEVPLALLILGGSTFLRFVMIGAYPIGIEGDEIKWASGYLDYMVGDIGRWPASLAFDVGPVPFAYMPLFYGAFGASIGSARIAAATLSTIANVVFYFFARRALGVPSGLLATLLLGISLGDIAASRDAHIEAQVKIWVVLAPFFAAWAIDRLRALPPGSLDMAAPSVAARLRDLWDRFGAAPLLCLFSGASLICGLLVYDTFASMAIVVGLYLGVALLVMLIRAPKGWVSYLVSGTAFALPILMGTPRVIRVLYIRQGSHDRFDAAWGPNLIPSPEHAQLVLAFIGKNLNDFMTSLFVHQRVGDFILVRPGAPWENAILLPLLVIGLAWSLARFRQGHNGLIILWAVLAPIPGAIVLGWPAYRIVYPAAPAFCLLMAVGLWACYAAFVATARHSWRPALAAGLVAFLGTAALINSHIYFRELPSFDDRLNIREMANFTEQNVGPGRMVLVAYLPNAPGFIGNSQEIQFVARGVIGIWNNDANSFRQVAYADLLPSIFELRDRYTDIRVIAEGPPTALIPQRQATVDQLVRCFPGTSVEARRFSAIYSIPGDALANTRCVMDRGA